MTIQTEGGLRPSRIEYVEEDEQGVTPTDPAWLIPSDRMTMFETDGFGPEAVEKAALGETVHELSPGLEEPEITVGYDLQRWFTDGSGNPDDLSAYGIQRVAGSTPSSLTIVERIESGDATENVLLAPQSTVDYHYNDNASATAKASRIYTVSRGCEVAAPTLTADPSEVDWAVETTVQPDRGRSFQIDQPPSTTTLVVASTASGDNNVSVTIESEGAGTTETVALDGTDSTTPVVTTSTFSDIDAIQAEDGSGNVADHAGDIIVSINSGTTTAPTAGEALSVLYGSNFYGNTTGDYGVPALGGGSHGTAIGTEFYKVGNLGVFRPASTLFEAAGSVQTIELSVENDNERTAIQRSREQRIHIGMQTIEMTVTYDSETGSHQNLVQRMSMEELDTVLEFDRAGAETVTLADTIVAETARTREATENSSEQEVTLRAQPPGITFSAPAA